MFARYPPIYIQIRGALMNVLKVDLQASNAAELFVRSLRETGFGVVTNHGVPDKMIQNLYREWKKFCGT